MHKFQKYTLFVFFLLFIYDLYDCTKPGFEVSVWLRPLNIMVLFVFVFDKKRPFLELSMLFGSLLFAAIAEGIFYSTGLVYVNTLITLLFLKNLCFTILLQNPKNKLRFSLKFFRWAFTYLVISLTICLLTVGDENLFSYLFSVQSGMVMFHISLQIKGLALFRQLYLGYALLGLAMIFGKIHVLDTRWFIEIITRVASVFGHLLFISALANVKLLPTKSNTLDYQTVK
jgi:hypothetical protein